MVKRTMDKYYAFKFINLLTQDWTEMDAYELGIIDEDGEQLKKRKELTSNEEKDAYTRFHSLVFSIRRMLEKVPFAKSTIGRYAAALALIKEEYGVDLDNQFQEYLKENNIEIPTIHQILLENEQDYDYNILNVYWEKTENGLQPVGSLEETVMTTGVDMGAGATKKPDDEDLEERGDTQFAGDAVFVCDPDTFQNCRLGKKKYLKYSTYVGQDEVGERVRKYGRKHPKRGIILKNSQTGAMIYLRRGEK